MTISQLMDYRKYHVDPLENNWHRPDTRSALLVEQIFHKSGYLWVQFETSAPLLGWPKDRQQDVY